jgi:hypothetical protein
LVLLVVGCVLVASPSFQVSGGPARAASDTRSQALGIAAVLCMVSLSGYAAVYFEGMLKGSEKLTIWLS